VVIVYPTFIFSFLLSIIYISISIDRNAIGRKCFHFSTLISFQSKRQGQTETYRIIVIIEFKNKQMASAV
jgi:hypothetical protein